MTRCGSRAGVRFPSPVNGDAFPPGSPRSIAKPLGVIPAKAGTPVCGALGRTEIPAFAGMTRCGGGVGANGDAFPPDSPRSAAKPHGVIPAKAGTPVCTPRRQTEIPAFAGMTRCGSGVGANGDAFPRWTPRSAAEPPGVIPAKAGTSVCRPRRQTEIPAFAGMTRCGSGSWQTVPANGGVRGGTRSRRNPSIARACRRPRKEQPPPPAFAACLPALCRPIIQTPPRPTSPIGYVTIITCLYGQTRSGSTVTGRTSAPAGSSRNAPCRCAG